MITIDTNVLVRAIVDDAGQPEQTQKARALVEKAQRVYVPQIVLVEFIWVLTKTYKIDKTTLLGVLKHFLVNPAYVLQRQEIFNTAVNIFKDSQADFADCIIWAESSHKQSLLYTFDKRLGRHPDTQLL